MKDKFLEINKPINNIMLKKNFEYIFIFIISLCIPTFFMLVKSNIIGLNNIALYSIEAILALLDIDLIILNIINKEFKYEHIFLSLIIPIGLLYLILLLPNNVPDEAAHAYRAYDLGQGNIFTRQDKDKSPKIVVPKDLLKSLEVNNYKELGKRIQTKTNYNDKTLVNKDGLGASTYSGFAYIFSSISFRICQLLGINIFISYYLARILTFLASVVIIYYAIKLIPFGKILLLFYVFNPMFMQQLVSISADNIINSLSLLFIAIILYRINSKKKLDTKKQVVIAAITLVLAVLKYTYLPLSFLLLLLVDKKEKENNKKIFILLGLAIVVSILAYLSTNMYISENSSGSSVGINPSEPMHYILTHPISYIITLLKTTYYNSSFYFHTLFGGHLGQLNISVNEIITIVYAYILLFTPFLDDTKLYLNKKQKIYFGLVFIIIYGLIETGLYLLWTKIGGSIIEGVQGRYFIPIFILIPLMIINNKNKLTFKNTKLFVCLAAIIINLLCIISIINFFNY